MCCTSVGSMLTTASSSVTTFEVVSWCTAASVHNCNDRFLAVDCILPSELEGQHLMLWVANEENRAPAPRYLLPTLCRSNRHEVVKTPPPLHSVGMKKPLWRHWSRSKPHKVPTSSRFGSPMMCYIVQCPHEEVLTPTLREGGVSAACGADTHTI